MRYPFAFFNKMVLFLVGILLSVGGIPMAVHAQLSEGIQVQNATGDATVAFVFQPKNIAKNLGDEDLANDFFEYAKEGFGIELDHSDYVLFEFNPSLGTMPHSTAPMFAMSAKQDREFEPDSIMNNKVWSFDFQETEVAGNTIFWTDSTPDGPCFSFPENTSAILSTRTGIEFLVDDENTRQPEWLLEIGSNWDIVGNANIKDDRDAFQAIFADLFFGQEEGLDVFHSLVDQVDSANFRLNLADSQFEFILVTSDPETAESVKAELESAMTSISFVADANANDMDDSTEAAKRMKNFLSCIVQFENDLTIKVVDKKVEVRVEDKESISNLMTSIVDGVNFFLADEFVN